MPSRVAGDGAAGARARVPTRSVVQRTIQSVVAARARVALVLLLLLLLLKVVGLHGDHRELRDRLLPCILRTCA